MTNENNLPENQSEEVVIVTAASEVEVARADVEATQGSIGETLIAIKDKLNPGEIIDQAKSAATDVAATAAEKARETVHAVTTDVTEHAKEIAGHAREGAKEAAKGAVSGAVAPIKSGVHNVQDASSAVADRVKSNPLPLLLISAAAWYFYGRSQNRSSGRSSSPTTIRTTTETLESQDVSSNSGPGIVDKAKSAVGSAGDRVSSGLGTAKDAVTSGVGAAKDAISSGVETAKDAVSSGVDRAKSAGSDLVSNIQSNPLPYALIGLGAGMLMRSSRQSDNVNTDTDIVYYGDTPAEGSEERTLLDRARGTAGEAVHRVGGAASSARDFTARKVDSGRSAINDVFESNPLLVGAIVAGVGAGLALLLPKTEFESNLMGDASDRLKEEAKSTVRDLQGQAKEVVQETLDAAKEGARDRGLVM